MLFSQCSQLPFKCFLQIRKRLHLLPEPFPLLSHLSLQSRLLVAPQFSILNLQLQCLDLCLFHLNFLFVVLNLLRTLLDLSPYNLELFSLAFDLSRQTFAGLSDGVIPVFSVFGPVQLLFDFTLESRLEFSLDALHLGLLALHHVLVVGFLLVVAVDSCLDLGSYSIVLIHLCGADVTVCIELVLNLGHSCLILLR